MTFFTSSNSLANSCSFTLGLGLLGQQTESLTISAGDTRELSRIGVKYIINGGVNTAEVKVKGWGAAPAWHRLHKTERYDGLVDLQSLRCLSSSEAPRNKLEQLANRVSVEAGMLAETSQNIATSTKQRVDKALSTMKDTVLKWYDNANTDQWLSVGRAVLCDTYLGNQDNQRILNLDGLQFRGARGNRNKFNNLVITEDFNVMNNYLLMQASNKTYYHQLKYGFDAEKRIWNKANTEREFRCATQELYRYWGFDDVWFVNGSLGGNAVIGIDNDKVVIAVRGTQNPAAFTGLVDFTDNQSGPANFYELINESIKGSVDVLLNMSHFPKVPAAPLGFANSGEIHGGYAMAAQELHLLIDLINPIVQLNNRPIFVAGHSLGGATATLLAKRMQQQGYNIQAAYIYAPPKVGDRNFTTELRNNLNLFVTWNYRDPVPTFMNSAWGKLGDFSTTGIDQFRFTWEGAQTFVFFDQAHQANTFDPTTQRAREIYLAVREAQGAPYPEILLRNGLQSEEWFFHSGNFYTAFTYNEVRKAGLSAANNTTIAPEFIKEPMCLFWSDSFKAHAYDWNANYKRFTGDKQGYPMQHCMW